MIIFWSFKLGSVHILCIKVIVPFPHQGMVCLSSEAVSSAHCCSLDGEALLLHLSLLVLLKFRICLEQLQVSLEVFRRYTIIRIS